MSTFVIRFLHDLPDDYRGRVRHVRSGDEKNFGSATENAGDPPLRRVCFRL
jgi:hypothetical protein